MNNLTNIILKVKKLADKKNLIVEIDKTLQNEIIVEINDLIKDFNNNNDLINANNAKHLKKLLKGPLPYYETILSFINIDKELTYKVIKEFNESTYLDEVWKIKNIEHLYINLLILVYRTTLLNKYEYLRKGSAQISSSLEELAALKALEDKKTKTFKAVQLWLKKWKEEGFAHELYIDLVDKKLIK